MEKQRTIKDWIVATRPWSLTASAIPVLAVTAYIWWRDMGSGTELNWLNAVLSLIMLVMLQQTGNLIGDYYDHKKGVDKKEYCPNGVTWIHSGLFEPEEILHYGYTMLSIAAAIGLGILVNSSWEAVWLGVAGLLMVYFYPWLKAHALGDVDVLFGYALLPALGVSFVTTGRWIWDTMLVSLTYGLITVAILHANNTRDIDNDHGAGLNTLCIAIGLKVSQWLYIAEILMPYLLIIILYFCDILPIWSFLTFLSLPVAITNCRKMLPSKGVELQIATLDQQTAKLQMMFGLLMTVSFVVARFV